METRKIVTMDFNQEINSFVIDLEFQYSDSNRARDAFNHWFDCVDSKWEWSIEKLDSYTWIVKSDGDIIQVVKLVDVVKEEVGGLS